MKQMEEDASPSASRLSWARSASTRLPAATWVVAVANGLGELKEVRIKPEVVDPEDVEMLQNLVTAVVNEALTRAQARREERMAEVTGGLNIPGMGKLPF